MSKLAFGLFFTCVLLSAQTPVILNYSKSASPGDILFVQGANFGSTPAVEYSYADSNWTAVAPTTTGIGLLTFRMPAGETRLPDLLTLRVSADNQSWSTPVYVNRSIATSFDTDQVAPSSSFRTFGRNLYFARQPSVRFVDTTDGSSLLASVSSNESSHYVLRVTAPPGIQPGHVYQVFVSNGYGGNGSPIESTADETLTGRIGGIDSWQLGTPWAADLNFAGNVYNVKSDPRLSGILAIGDGLKDDTWALMHAIQVASAAGGGVIYLPPGNYSMNLSNGCNIQLLKRVVIQGAGSATTNITYGSNANGTTGAYGVCWGDQTGIADVTLTNVDQKQQWQFSGLSQSNQEVFMNRVVWNIGTAQWITFMQDDHVAIKNSTINQGTDASFNFLGPFLLQSSRHVTMTDNNISFAVGGISLDFASDVVFERNTVTRNMWVPVPDIAVTHSIAANFTNNLVVLSNNFNGVGTAAMNCNCGEVLNTEGGATSRRDEFRGAVTSASATSLTDYNRNFNSSSNVIPQLQPSAIVAIVSGNANGEWRTVTSVSPDGTTVTIDRPWDVAPEPGAHYATFDWSARAWIVANNTLTGNWKGLEVYNASALDLLFESNTLLDSDGIMVSPDEYEAVGSGGGFQVIYGLEVSGNTLIDKSGLRPAYVGILPREDRQSAGFGTHFIGSVIRGNNVTTEFQPNFLENRVPYDDYQVKSEGYLAAYYWQSQQPYQETSAPMLGIIFQGNIATNSNAAYYVNSGSSAVIIADALNNHAVVPLNDSALPGATRGSVGTGTINGRTLFKIDPISLQSLPNAHFDAAVSNFGGAALSATQGAPTSTFAGVLVGTELGLDGSATVHLSLSHAAASGLLMMREPAGRAFVSIGLEPQQIVIQNKLLSASTVQEQRYPFNGTSAWLALDKTGPAIKAMYSTDGIAWQQQIETNPFPGRRYMAGVVDSSVVGNLGDADLSLESLMIAANPSAPPVQSSANAGRVNPAKLAWKETRNLAVAFWRALKKGIEKIFA